jgi:diguanylate cyclase (GGDEF)-like protein
MYLRKGNLKFTVTQNNLEKNILVDELAKSIDDRRGGDYFGYQNNDLVGHDLREFLPEDVREILDDNIEYSLEGNDLKTVVEKIINFKIFNAEKAPIDMNAYVERSLSTPEKLSFSMVLERKIFLQDKIKTILANISSHQQIRHDVTGLINTSAFHEALNELLDFLYDARVEAVFCIISIEGFSNIRMQEGKERSDEILAGIGKVLTATLRTRDIVGYLGFGKFAVLMARTFEDEVIYPIKRIESGFKKEGVLNSKISYNVRYQKVDMEHEVKDIIELVQEKKIDYTMSIGR